MPALVIIALILAWPLLEIAAFIWVGGQIGILPTLAAILLTSFVGFWLVRLQSLPLITVIRAQMEMGQIPARAMADGAMIAAGGALLMLPGFVTDAIGLLFFVPPVRALIFHAFSRRITVYNASYRRERAAAAGVIDLDRDDWENRADNGNTDPRSSGSDTAGIQGSRGPTPWLPPERP